MRMLIMEPPLNHLIALAGKPVEIRLTDRARNALSARTRPLNVEMELLFSCLLRKQVRFQDHHEGAAGVPVNDRLYIHFRPVMTAACGPDLHQPEPALTDFPLAHPRAYVPHWLRIDYRKGAWLGEFGYLGQHH
jgi:hypothetical protein